MCQVQSFFFSFHLVSIRSGLYPAYRSFYVLEMFWVVNNTELEIGDTAILHFGNLTQRQGCISLMFGATSPIVFAFYFEYKANEDTEFTSIQGRSECIP